MTTENNDVTTWFNPLDVPQRVTLRLTHGGQSGPGKVKQVTIAPGKTVMLPSEYDQAIRELDKNGVVVGGLAPMLQKQGQENVKVHESLDFKRVADEIELVELAKQAEKDNARKEAVKLKAERDLAKAAKK